MTRFGAVRVVVEFMDGVTRTYEPVGGAISSPRLAGDGANTVVLELGYQNGHGARMEHVATIPLANIREYRMAPL